MNGKEEAFNGPNQQYLWEEILDDQYPERQTHVEILENI